MSLGSCFVISALLFLLKKKLKKLSNLTFIYLYHFVIPGKIDLKARYTFS